jgi:hypothetical protein
MPLLRVLIITEKAVYNVPVSDYTILKRRIPLDLITSATASKISSEVVLHVPEEYDFRFQVVSLHLFFMAISDENVISLIKQRFFKRFLF